MKSVQYPGNSGPLIEIVGDEGERIVAVYRDGSVTYGDDVDLDDASRRFWQALACELLPEKGGFERGRTAFGIPIPDEGR